MRPTKIDFRFLLYTKRNLWLKKVRFLTKLKYKFTIIFFDLYANPIKRKQLHFHYILKAEVYIGNTEDI